MIISEGQRRHYDTKKQATLDAIREAVRDLQEAGIPVTRQALVDFTGRSDATFSLPHVKALLQELRVCQYAPKRKVSDHELIRTDLSGITKERDSLRKKVESMTGTILALEGKNRELLQKLEAALKETESLRGRLQQALEIADIKGSDISRLFTS